MTHASVRFEPEDVIQDTTSDCSQDCPDYNDCPEDALYQRLQDNHDDDTYSTSMRATTGDLYSRENCEIFYRCDRRSIKTRTRKWRSGAHTHPSNLPHSVVCIAVFICCSLYTMSTSDALPSLQWLRDNVPSSNTTLINSSSSSSSSSSSLIFSLHKNRTNPDAETGRRVVWSSKRIRRTESTSGIACYSCFFLHEGGHFSGQAGCDDPFQHLNIGEQMCNAPCAKVYRSLDAKGGFQLTRGCSVNCKEVDEISGKKGYTKCCTGKLCNFSPTRFNLSKALTLVLTFTNLVVVTFTWR